MELSDEEIVKIRAIIKEDERMIWLWALLRRWIIGIAGILAGIVAFWDSIRKFIQMIMGA